MQTSMMDEAGLLADLGSVSTFCGPSGPILGMLLGADLSVLCGMLGERFQVSFAPCAFERSPPTLILVPAFIQ